MKRVLVGFGVAVAVLAGVTGCAAQQEREVAYGVTEAVRVLVVDGGTGDVEVVGEGAEVRVTERQSYRGTAPEAEHRVADGTLTLSYRCPEDGCGVSYQVRVPAGTVVKVKAGTGSVRLVGLTGEVEASAGTGGIAAEGLGGAKVQLTAGTGDVRVGFAVAPSDVRVKAGTGSVRVTVPKGEEYAVEAAAGTGSVDVRVPVRTGSERKIVARAATGDVTVSGG
ncbi:DUF4097 family beta strand repeat-containing protein [Kitasatospora sp. NPDC101801]|uniref:DUF4097 family beta strand repeat-containing protein n=1 Tax=Kitasatospora sp. NPDC101801 TaxID=3364103 RepID=UPI003824FAA8